ncbi:mitogen-activated protein kinase kinase kinase 17 [Cajanus cajan]|uniref:Mitogen-activated protein kinase kinase kinase 2 n=1 Tax=Cajanus cajan TaxID=3821 RepID=A0A151R1R5_CAJCA|nr:mitogen-activated protein kinase kinase kinase 17 [Cajanus cajan]KYP36476.1 Mitogen-activated protein kinase kinase kinase 2 [Cajanus cajan]
MNWVRGASIGRGSFATINIAIPTNDSTHFPSPFVVKSSNTHTSHMLNNEKHVLHNLGSSPYIITCFGDDHTVENGQEFHNLFLEHAAGGSLADHLDNHGGRFPEPHVRRYTRTIAEALKHVHARGFVHCDVKLQNILVFDEGNVVKIADFGLAKARGEKYAKSECRGTPLFMSPESVNDNEYEPPADVWALGCAVVEMVTGKPAWEVGSGSNIWSLLIRIGVGDELPKIPEELSQEGKDFLGKCFVKDPKKRWSAEMLLNHPFIAHQYDHTVSLDKVKDPLPSPSTHFDFPHWASTPTLSLPSSPDWSESDGWINVR